MHILPNLTYHISSKLVLGEYATFMQSQPSNYATLRIGFDFQLPGLHYG